MLSSLPTEILRPEILIQSELTTPLCWSDVPDKDPSCPYERNKLAFLFDIPSYLDTSVFINNEDFKDFIRKEIPRSLRVSSTMKIAVDIIVKDILSKHTPDLVHSSDNSYRQFLKFVTEDDDVELMSFILKSFRIPVYVMSMGTNLIKLSTDEELLISIAIQNLSVQMLQLIVSTLTHRHKPSRLSENTLTTLVRRPELYTLLMNEEFIYCPELLHIMIKEDDIEGVNYLLFIGIIPNITSIYGTGICSVSIYTHAMIFRRTKILKMLIEHYNPSDQEIRVSKIDAKKSIVVKRHNSD